MSIIESIYPEKLEPGDTIGIAAPAGSFNKKVFVKGVKLIEQMGYNVHVPREIMQEEKWFAGDDDSRVSVLHNLFLNPEIKAIVSARGGYGSTRIINKIDYDIIRNNPKIFMGFSDISALLNAFNNRTGLICFHSPVVTSLPVADVSTIKSFENNLSSDYTGELSAVDGVEIFPGKSIGRIAGGNLTILNHLTGTEFAPDFHGTILLLEDVAEAPYRIDRMLTQMKNSGLFNDVSGIVLGQFDGCGEYREIIEIFEEIFYSFEIPVVAGFGFGHTDLNITFPIGVKAELDSKTLILKY